MASKFFTSQGDVTIPEPPLAHTLFSTTRFAWLWALIRIFLGYQWVSASLHKLQDPQNKREIMADAKLKPVFGGKDKVSMFEMNKHLAKHLK